MTPTVSVKLKLEISRAPHVSHARSHGGSEEPGTSGEENVRVVLLEHAEQLRAKVSEAFRRLGVGPYQQARRTVTVGADNRRPPPRAREVRVKLRTKAREVASG